MNAASSLSTRGDPHADLMSRRAALFAQPLPRGNIPKRRSDAIDRLEWRVASTEPRTLAGALCQLEFAWEGVEEDMNLTLAQRRAMQTAMTMIGRLAGR